MRLRTVDPSNVDSATIAEAAAIIRRGGLVAFPTETVYGLGADATNAEAVASIFAAKGRPSYNPLIVHVSSVTVALRHVTSWPEPAARLAERFWPGPLTLVLPRHESIPDIVTAGLATVGVRMPNHPVALALLRAADVPIAAPSANRSMEVSPTEAKHVAESLGVSPDMILDSGPSPIGIESTVLDLSGPVPTILRPGMISRSALSELIGDVAYASDTQHAGARPSPGMMDRHYSPRARVIVAADRASIDTIVAHELLAGKRVALMSISYRPPGISLMSMPETPEGYARSLYRTLRQVDTDGADVVIVEAVPDGDAWDGVRDRIRRAATSASSP